MSTYLLFIPALALLVWGNWFMRSGRAVETDNPALMMVSVFITVITAIGLVGGSFAAAIYALFKLGVLH